jgi:hypothetical protein
VTTRAKIYLEGFERRERLERLERREAIERFERLERVKNVANWNSGLLLNLERGTLNGVFGCVTSSVTA